jgi:hypothetical protein
MHGPCTKLNIKLKILYFLLLDSMAQSVICQPIIQSDGKLAGMIERKKQSGRYYYHRVALYWLLSISYQQVRVCRLTESNVRSHCLAVL